MFIVHAIYRAVLLALLSLSLWVMWHHQRYQAVAFDRIYLVTRCRVVPDRLGHRSSATTDRYLKSDNRERLAYAQAMGEQLFRQVA